MMKVISMQGNPSRIMDRRNCTRCFFICIIVSLRFCVIAQPIIDSSNYSPKKLDLFERKICNFTNVNYKSTGNNYSWNFTSLPFVTSDTIMYDSLYVANTCMYNYPPLGAWWQGNLAMINGSPPYTTFFKQYTVSGITEGADATCAGCVYEASYLHFPFPLTVATNYSVSEIGCGYCLSNPWPNNSCNTYFTYHHQLTADGYGTLNLPGGITYFNCLRLMEVVVDSNSNSVVDTVFYWLSPGIHHQVLEIKTNYPFQESGIYISAYKNVSNVHALHEEEFSIYPNPTNGIIFLQGNLPNDQAIFQTFDLLGNRLKTRVIKVGEFKIALDFTDLFPGYYTLQVGKSFRRIIKN